MAKEEKKKELSEKKEKLTPEELEKVSGGRPHPEPPQYKNLLDK